MNGMNEKGFTLLEVMVAGLILAIGLLGVAGMMTNAVRGNDYGKRLTTAQRLAQQRMEQFKHLNYSDAKLLNYNIGNITRAGCGTDADPDYPDSDIDYDPATDTDDADDNAFEFEAYGLEDYGTIEDEEDETITYPHYRRETLIEAGSSATANGCGNPPSDLTARVTVLVKWQGVTGDHTVKAMTLLAK